MEETKTSKTKNKIRKNRGYKSYNWNSAQEIFSRNMKKRRIQLGYSQEHLANITGLHRNYIGGIEQLNRNPSLKNIWKIANGLNIPASCLMDKNYKGEKFTYAIVELEDDDFKFQPINDKKLLKHIEDYIQENKV